MDSLNVLEKLAERISNELLALVAIALVLLIVVAKNLIPDSDRQLKRKILLYTYVVNGSVILVCLVLYASRGCNDNSNGTRPDSCVVTLVVPVDLRKGTVFLNDQEGTAELTSEGFKIRVRKNTLVTLQARKEGDVISEAVAVTVSSDTTIHLRKRETPPPLEFCKVTVLVPVDLENGTVYVNGLERGSASGLGSLTIQVAKNKTVDLQVRKDGYKPSRKITVHVKSDTTIDLRM